jgi:hypothetical protein
LPKEKHIDFMQLSERDRRTVAQLGAILRLAEPRPRTRNRVTDIKFKRDNKIFASNSRAAKTAPSNASHRAEKDLFEMAFGCRLIVE